MKPIKFKEWNKTLLRPYSITDKECESLPVYTDGIMCLSCWKLSFVEKLKVLFFGKIWLSVRSGKRQPPVSLNCWRNAFIKDDKEA